jgi:hypothetical protein
MINSREKGEESEGGYSRTTAHQTKHNEKLWMEIKDLRLNAS